MTSAGLLMFTRHAGSALQFFLVHPGGPYFKNKNEGYWGIPKGLPENNETLLATAIREFAEETGITPMPPYLELDMVHQKGGKKVHAWAFENQQSLPEEWQSNTFLLEWPPKSGQMKEFPEIDKAGYFERDEAIQLINDAQKAFIIRLEVLLQQETESV